LGWRLFQGLCRCRFHSTLPTPPLPITSGGQALTILLRHAWSPHGHLQARTHERHNAGRRIHPEERLHPSGCRRPRPAEGVSGGSCAGQAIRWPSSLTASPRTHQSPPSPHTRARARGQRVGCAGQAIRWPWHCCVCTHVCVATASPRNAHQSSPKPAHTSSIVHAHPLTSATPMMSSGCPPSSDCTPPASDVLTSTCSTPSCPPARRGTCTHA
jgi:hypothetical protein